MPVYRINRTAESYGQAIGILMLDRHVPFIPGDVGNASTFGYPVIYRVVPGLTPEACLDGAPELEEPVTEAARALVGEGVRGISSGCGFMLQYQDAVRDAVNVPVCLSSLLQLPFISRTLRPGQPIGIVTADSNHLSESFLRRAGLEVDNPLVIHGMQDEPEFGSATRESTGTLDSDLVSEETVGVARRMVDGCPDMGAVLLECSMLPPYARVVQDAIRLPVYDFITLIDFMQSGTNCRPPQGFM
jgi:hypothetical protein